MPRGEILKSEIDLTLFVACYNEEPNIIGTLETVQAALKEFKYTWEIIIIDDASQDNSVAVVQDYLRQHLDLPIRLYVNPVNKGLGQNFIEGAYLGRGEYYRLICGDNVEPKDALIEIFKHIGEADVVIVYQDCRGRTFGRRMLSRFFTFIVNFISGYRIKYYNGMAIHRRYNVMRWHTNYHGFGFQADMIVRLLDEGFHYTEVNVVTHERQQGVSSALTLRNFFSVMHTFIDLFVRRVAKSRFFNKRATRAKALAPQIGPVPFGPDANHQPVAEPVSSPSRVSS